MSEHDEQAALFAWADLQANSMPELKLMFAIPNGGHRHKVTAAKMRAEGVKAGIPDVFLPVSRGRWHGLFVEMKFGRNKATAEQQAWSHALHNAGYQVVLCYGFEEAQKAIMSYLASKPAWYQPHGD